MKDKKNILQIIQENKEEMKRFGAKRIGLFGSFAKSTHNKKSDIDILVEFSRGKKTFDNYMDLKFFLQKLLGRKVDLVIKGTLKPQIKPRIIKEVKYA